MKFQLQDLLLNAVLSKYKESLLQVKGLNPGTLDYHEWQFINQLFSWTLLLHRVAFRSKVVGSGFSKSEQANPELSQNSDFIFRTFR